MRVYLPVVVGMGQSYSGQLGAWQSFTYLGDLILWFLFFSNEREIGGMESAHDSFIWNLSWHPLGHVLVSCSSDHTSKFWCRNRPGEEMRDRYNTASALITEEAVEGEKTTQWTNMLLL